MCPASTCTAKKCPIRSHALASFTSCGKDESMNLRVGNRMGISYEKFALGSSE